MTINPRTTCSVCHDGRFSDAREVAKVRSNVRRWRTHMSTVWRCPACSSLNSLERVDLNLFYADYPFRNRRLDGYTRAIFSALYKRLERFGLSQESTVLDYGCSEGLFLEYLKERGISSASGYDAFVEKYADKTPLSRTYDFVVAQDLIEHAEAPPALFASLCALVKPGGILYIGTPCADRIDLANAEHHIHSLHQPYHICILSEQSVRSLSRSNDLTIEKMEFGHIADTPIPFINWEFLRAYLATIDDTLDAGFDPPRIGTIASSPTLLFKGLFGYFLRRDTEMFVFLRKPVS